MIAGVGRGDVAATIRELEATDCTEVVAIPITLLGDAARARHLQTGEVGAELEVDRSCDRVRPVDRRPADGYIVDAFDQRSGNIINVDLGACRSLPEQRRHVRRNEAAAVHQRQRTVRSQAEAVDEVHALPEAALRAARRDAATDSRQFVQRVCRVGKAPFLDIAAADRGRRL
jgi:hypothetical protein